MGLICAAPAENPILDAGSGNVVLELLLIQLEHESRYGDSPAMVEARALVEESKQ